VGQTLRSCSNSIEQLEAECHLQIDASV
jgi:hypothetical protein